MSTEVTASKASVVRRTAGSRPHGRAERVVEQVLHATAQELSEGGYAALRVEAVALRAGVNKTTVYRRWPTRADLVAAALAHMKQPLPDETGNLEDDLTSGLRAWVRFAESPLGHGLLRVLQTERGHIELEPIVRTLRAAARTRRAELVARAIERGALPPGTDAMFVADLAFSFVFARLVTCGEHVSEELLRSTVETVLAGVRSRSARDCT